jgi:hypothetical protein
MPFVKSCNRFGKKQTAPTVKKTGAKKTAKKVSAAGESSKSKKKRGRSTQAFSSLKAKQLTVERMKRAIWAALLKINEAIINAASNGNLASAKELFHFAGVYSLPNPDEENAAVAAMPMYGGETATVAEPAQVHPIDLFFKKIGVEPSCAEPESEVA